MDVSQIYIIIAVVVLLVIVAVVFFKRKNKKKERLSPLAGVALGFILAGIFFSGNKWISYSLMGIGIIIAIVDIVLKEKFK